jgi:hypothetical protein
MCDTAIWVGWGELASPNSEGVCGGKCWDSFLSANYIADYRYASGEEEAMSHPNRLGLQMGCGERLSGSTRQLRELARRPRAMTAGKRQSRSLTGGRAGR